MIGKIWEACLFKRKVMVIYDFAGWFVDNIISRDLR